MKDLKPRSLRIAIAGINVGTNPLRPLNGEEVKRLAVSMERIGLMIPITVRYHIDRPSSDGATDSYELIAGRHRLAAALSLGWDEIDAIEIECSDVDAKLWEIAENLHRAELTKLERDEQIALWIELTGEKVQSAGVRRIEPDDGQRPLSKMDLWAKGLPTEPNEVQVAPHKKRGQQPGGISAAARELGIEETDAKRAVKVASLSDEAKAAAREHGLDNNRSALLEAAREKDHEAQVDKIVARANKKTTDAMVECWADQMSEQQLADYRERGIMPAWHMTTACGMLISEHKPGNEAEPNSECEEGCFTPEDFARWDRLHEIRSKQKRSTRGMTPIDKYKHDFIERAIGAASFCHEYAGELVGDDEVWEAAACAADAWAAVVTGLKGGSPSQ